jgi:hypothetical protein
MEERYHSSLLLGLTNYLIILELIGSVFKLKNNDDNYTKDGIEYALKLYTKLGNEKIKGIKALRNSLTHNFSLANNSHNFEISTDFIEMIEIPDKIIEFH